MAFSLYSLEKTPNGELVYTSIHSILHLIDGPTANIMIGTDIIGLEGIIIILTKKSAYVSSYVITFETDVNQQTPFICRTLLAQDNVIVSPHSQALISFTSTSLPDDRHILFKLLPSQGRITLFLHLMDYHSSSILIHNNCRRVAQIPQNY